MKYMRNYASEDDFTADTTNMESIENDGKIWFSYIKDPKSIKIKYKERPAVNDIDYNSIMPNTETLDDTDGTVEFNNVL